MGLSQRQSWMVGIGSFVFATAFGLVPSLWNAFVPGVLLSAWVGGGGLVFAMMTSTKTTTPPAWTIPATALAIKAPPSLAEWEACELPHGRASLTPWETSFDEDNWTWAHNGEIVH